jgi:hypothetical protein
MTQPSGADNSTMPSTDSELADQKAALFGGENPHTFRVAKAIHEAGPIVSDRPDVVERVGSRSAVELGEITPTFLQHEALTGRPFSASYYQMDKVYDRLGADQSIFRGIDSYVMKEVSEGRMADGAEAVTSFIQSIESKLNLEPFHDPFYRSKRVAEYLTAAGDYIEHDHKIERLRQQTREKVARARTTATEAQKYAEQVAQSAQQQVTAAKTEKRQAEQVVRSSERKIRSLTAMTQRLLTSLKQTQQEKNATVSAVRAAHAQKIEAVRQNNLRLKRENEVAIHRAETAESKYRQKQSALRALLASS